MDGVAHTETGQVKNHIHPRQDLSEGRFIPDVGHGQATTVPSKVLQIFPASVDQVIHHDHGGSTITKVVGQFGTDKTGTPGDNHSHIGKIAIHYCSQKKLK
jgi:hypothetical protein